MKICGHCKEEKSLIDFALRNKKAGARHSYCKSCQTIYNKKHYRNNRLCHLEKAVRNRVNSIDRAFDFVSSHLSLNPCIDCGEIDPIVLEFDHIVGNKDHNISNMIQRGYGISSIRREIKKCVVRCANCHRRRTAKQFGWRKYQSVA